jgi:hypothetical protein
VFIDCRYRDKKVVGVFVRFRAPLHPMIWATFPITFDITYVFIK